MAAREGRGPLTHIYIYIYVYQLRTIMTGGTTLGGSRAAAAVHTGPAGPPRPRRAAAAKGAAPLPRTKSIEQGTTTPMGPQPMPKPNKQARS